MKQIVERRDTLSITVDEFEPVCYTVLRSGFVGQILLVREDAVGGLDIKRMTRGHFVEQYKELQDREGTVLDFIEKILM